MFSYFKSNLFWSKSSNLDEPTSALGVHQASVVLKYIVKAAASGFGVIFNNSQRTSCLSRR